MPFVSGAVYDPPRADLPHVAVVFGPDGEVLTARKVPSLEQGEALLQGVMRDFQEQIDADLAGKSA